MRSNGVSLQAPASVEAAAALLERVRSSDGDERMNAILALALGGNIEAFEYLLGREDVNGLFLFGSQSAEFSYKKVPDVLTNSTAIIISLLPRLPPMK